jgi:hypothetical protein
MQMAASPFNVLVAAAEQTLFTPSNLGVSIISAALPDRVMATRKHEGPYVIGNIKDLMKYTKLWATTPYESPGFYKHAGDSKYGMEKDNQLVLQIGTTDCTGAKYLTPIIFADNLFSVFGHVVILVPDQLTKAMHCEYWEKMKLGNLDGPVILKGVIPIGAITIITDPKHCKIVPNVLIIERNRGTTGPPTDSVIKDINNATKSFNASYPVVTIIQ